MVSPAVGRGRVHAASFVTPFRLWNDVSIFCNSEVISTFGSAAMLTLAVDNVSHCRTIGQILLYWYIEPSFRFKLTLLLLKLAMLLLLPVLVRHLDIRQKTVSFYSRP